MVQLDDPEVGRAVGGGDSLAGGRNVVTPLEAGDVQRGLGPAGGDDRGVDPAGEGDGRRRRHREHSFANGRLDGRRRLLGRPRVGVRQRPDSVGGRDRLSEREPVARGEEPRLGQLVGGERPPLGGGVVDEHRPSAEHVTDERAVTQTGEAGGAGQRLPVDERCPHRRRGRTVERVVGGHNRLASRRTTRRFAPPAA
ncbi:MAG: hypothetical protein J07HB67_02559 [halophilic archaeon J07HB67]|nr:MAG: hypothetical protein J07HB67_02559 [halophilic archaeon J07HB67]